MAEVSLAADPVAGLTLVREADRVRQAGSPLGGFLPGLRAAVVKLLAADRPQPVRVQACDAILQALPGEWPAVGAVAADRAAPTALRERAALGLAARPDPGCVAAALAYLPDASSRSAAQVAAAVAGTPAGADALLAAVRTGKASPRLLQDRAVRERLTAAKVPDVAVNALTHDLLPLEARLSDAIRDRAKLPPGDPVKGKAVFTQHCANCHQIGGDGAKVGPQLDGVGARGVERLCEDILDPSRNVDEAFRTRVVTMTDGRVVSGLFLRDDGVVTVLADSQGKEVRLAKADIEGWKVSPLSPMPANFDALPADDFRHLLAFLSSSRAK